MSFEACAALVERRDPDRYRATLTAPVAARGALFALYAYNLEVAKAPWVTSEEMIAEMRLQWWRDIVEEIGQGAVARAHEVAGPLRDIILDHGLPVDLFDQIAEARRWDIYKDAFEDEAAFEAHIDHTAGNLAWLAALILGAPAKDEAAVRKVAFGAGVANWLVAVPVLAERGRIPLLDGRLEGVQELARRALSRLEQGRASGVSPASAHALRTAWQARRLLQLAIREPMRVGDETLALAPITAKGSLLWKTLTGRF